MGGKIIPRIRLTSAKDLVEVEAELGKNKDDPKKKKPQNTRKSKQRAVTKNRTI